MRHLTPSDVPYIEAAPTLLAAAGRFKRLIADRGDEAMRPMGCVVIFARGARAVILVQLSRKRPPRREDATASAGASKRRSAG